jgi:predicted O-methyltransferase YrrM
MKLENVIADVFDAVQILGLDLLNPLTRADSRRACVALRNFSFRAHATVRPITLRELMLGITVEPQREVVLPSAVTDTQGIGDTHYYYCLAAIAMAVAPRRVLEFGTFLGISTLTLALNSPSDSRIYTVDLPDEVSPEAISTLNEADRNHVQTSRFRVGQAFRGHPVAHKISQISANSLTLNLNEYLPNEKVDLVFIDGGHTFEIILRDTENALSVLSPGGVVLWDDYWWFYPEVVRYLDALSKQLPVYRLEDTNLVIYTGRGRHPQKP